MSVPRFKRKPSDLDYVENSFEIQVEIMNLCPMKVFDVKNDKLIVKNIRNCTTCRECTRNQKHQELVNLGKESGHYEFHVESVGIYKVETIFIKALKVLKDKCKMWNDLLIQQDN